MNQKTRFKERLEGLKSGNKDCVTDSDLQNIEDFSATVDEMTGLLERETAIIEAREFERLPEVFEEKLECAKKMEVKHSIIEHLLGALAENEQVIELKGKIAVLREKMEVNGLEIERIKIAVSSVAKEMERIQKRHSLDGMYGKSGKKVNDFPGSKRRIDERF